MIKRYCKKPVVVEAVQWTGKNLSEISSFCQSAERFVFEEFRPALYIHTLEGNMRAFVGDYIIKGVGGEFYPCKPDIFEQTYEEVK